MTTPFDKRSKEDFIKIQTFIKKYTTWDDKLSADWEKSILPYAINKGAKSFGTLGR